MTSSEPSEFPSFDAFWKEQLRREAAEKGQQPTEVIRGVTVNVPQDLPLRFRARARAMRDDDSDAAFRELLAALFGVDVLSAWDEAGMGARELRVVLKWAMAAAEGEPITWPEAYALVMSKEDDDEGKAESSTQTNAASAAGGRSSKPTSTGNTASRRKR